MRKKILAGIAALSVLALTIPNSNIFADDYTGETPVNVGITGGTVTPPGVIDPPVLPPIGRTDFQVWRAPMKFDFNNVAYSSNQTSTTLNTSYHKAPDGGVAGEVDVVVADLRATGAGWTLQAEFLNAGRLTGTGANSSQVINNAKIEFEHSASQWTVLGPTAAEQTWASGGDITMGETTIDGTVRKFLHAAANTGQNYQGTRMKNVKLIIPGSQGKANVDYQGSVKWTLHDSPQ